MSVRKIAKSILKFNLNPSEIAKIYHWVSLDLFSMHESISDFSV